MTVAIVSGAFATKAGNGGNAWTRLAWVAALRSVGFDVWFVEQLPAGGGHEGSLSWFAAIAERFGLAGRAVVLDHSGHALIGPPCDEAASVIEEAELLLNIGGHLGSAGPASRIATRVFLDDDPGFTQFWEAAGSPGSRLAGHDVHLTYGANIGRTSCPIPTVGKTWHPILPPVTLDEWPATPAASPSRFTTVGTWRGPFGPVEHDGVSYGLKLHEFRKILELPRLVDADFALALAIDAAETCDLEGLSDGGWQLADPAEAADTPDRYRTWIQRSGAEISAAQGVYVGTSSGWVSDRTACYLASGRPALVQDTGQASALPTGEGLLTFTDVEDAAVKAAAIIEDHDRHARAARALAERHFDGQLIARHLCEIAQVAP